MTWESTMPVPYNVRIVVDIEVDATSREDAEQQARAHIGAGEITKTTVRRDWVPLARELLEQGMSQQDVAATLGASRAEVSRHFPGMGWTRQEGVAYRNMKKQLEDMGDFV